MKDIFTINEFMTPFSPIDPVALEKNPFRAILNMPSSALHLRLKRSYTLNNIIVEYKQTGPQFYTFGNPHMTNNIREFTIKDRKIALFALIGTHIQLVVGLILYFVSPLGKASLGNMTDSAVRLTSLEHPLLNIIAIILITIGWSKHKKAPTSQAKFKSIAVFYGLGLFLILIRIPWATWLSK